MSRLWISYEVQVCDETGKVIERYDNTRKTPVKRVYNQWYVEYKFGGVTGSYERSTIAINEGYRTVRPDGWSIRIVTTTDRSHI